MRFLIVGLGNPGYTGTPHNIGSDLLKLCFADLKKPITRNLDFFTRENHTIYMLYEPDLMNISGRKIKKAREKLFCEHLVVIADDLDCKGIITKRGTMARGHNGIRDIIKEIGKDFWRILIEVGRPSNGSVSEFVTNKFEGTKKYHYSLLEREILNIIESCSPPVSESEVHPLSA